MEELFAGKKVTWSDLEKYLSVHKKFINSYIDLLESELMTKSTIETILPNSFSIIYKEVTRILKDNNIRPSQEESKIDQLQFILKTVI
jgi:hypothetical protein